MTTIAKGKVAASVKDVAKLYWDAGLWITPVIAGGKKPKLKGWNKARPSWETLDSQIGVGTNIALVTGKLSGIVCLDIDVRHGGERWRIENEHRLGHHVIEHTPGGGYHLYFKYPEGLETVPTRRAPWGIAPGVELMGDGHGKVTTWPSEVKDVGGYKFENDLTLLDVVSEADELPLWILGIVPKKERVIAQRAIDGFDDSEANVDKVRQILEQFPRAIQGEGGDSTTFRACCICRDYGLSMQKAWELIQVYNANRCKPKWKENDLKAKVINAYSYATSGFGSESALAQFEAIPEQEIEQTQKEVTREDATPGYSKKKPFVNAQVFLARHGDSIIFNREQGFIYNPEKSRWELLDEFRLRSALLNDMRELSPGVAEASTSSRLKDAVSMIALLKQETIGEIEADRWLNGRTGDYVAARNGIVNIRTGELEPHSKEWFSFTSLPFEYSSDAKAPMFLDFLKSLWGDDQETIEALQLWIGYMLIRDMTQQKFALFIGESRSGKGTLATIIEQLLGVDNCVSATLTQLASDFGLSPLIGKRAVFFHDAQKAQGSLGDIATERLISIVGNDPQGVNRKNKEILTLRLPVKITMVCNQIPSFINTRGALTNRMLVFPFTESFRGKEDLELANKLKTELPGIFNWALKGAQNVLHGIRLYQSKRGEESLSEITQLLEPLAGFAASIIKNALDDIDWDSGTNWLEAKESFVSTDELYRAYVVWCSDHGHSPKSATKFASEIKTWLPKDAVPSQRKTPDGFKRGYLHIVLARKTPDFN